MVSDMVRAMRSARLVAFTMCLSLIGGVAAGQKPGRSPAKSPAKSPESRVSWKYSPKGSRFEEVVVHDGTVFALDRSGKIHALDAASGRKLWMSEGKESFGHGYGLALSAQTKFDAILVGCDSGLIALDRKSGKKLWHTKIAMGVAGPACTTKAVIAGSADGKVYACDLSTGKILWKHEFLGDAPEDPPGFAGEQARFGGRSARPRDAATDGKMVVLSIFDQCRALALDVETGKRLWDFRTKGWMHGRPAIGPRNVIVGSQDKHFYAIDKETGKLSWKVKTRARNEAGAASTARFDYFGSCDANLYAVDQGRISWKFATDHEKGRGAPIYSCPLVIGQTVYLAAMSGKVYALARKTGKLLWSVRPLANSQLNSDLVTDGKRLFVTTRKDGEVGQSAVLAIESR
jgi:outer membrane protein assembly factor BamB